MVRNKEQGGSTAAQTWNFMGSRGFFPPWQEQQRPPAGPEETLHVYRNYYPDHSRYCIAWRLQRHRRRPVLRHRILRRRRPRPGGRDSVDPVAVGKAVGRGYIEGRHRIIMSFPELPQIGE